MKKVLALVLAVMMLATTAFAATDLVINPDNKAYNGFKSWIPGTTIKLNDSGIVAYAPDDFVLAKDNDTNESKDTDGKVVVKSINTDNYTITGIKFNDGKKLVAGGSQGIKINNAEERVEIKLAQNYGKTTSSTLDVQFTLKGKKVGKTFKPENIQVQIKGTVGYNLVEKALLINPNGDVKVKAGTYYKDSAAQDKGTGGLVDPSNSEAFEYSDQIVWKVGKGGTDNYGDLDYSTADRDVDVTVRVYDGDKLYLYTDVDPVTDVLKAFADEDAEISFLNAPNTTFNSTATVRIYKEEGATYFYEWVDGKLIDMNGKAPAGAASINKKVNWDDDEGCYILKTRTLPNTLVMSDKPLPVDAVETPTTTPENPDTGANDVVGIATALAAVALVSAAAISLKK